MVTNPDWSFGLNGSPPGPSMSAPYPEWGDPAPGSPVQQGDVLSAISGEMDDWHQLLVVITADCDLAHAKHGGSLTCVPVIALDDYLVKFRIDKVRQTLQYRLAQFIVRQLQRLDNTESSPHISPERMQAWLAEDDIEYIARSLSERPLDKDASDLLRDTQDLIRAQDMSLSQALDRLATAKVNLGDATDHASARSRLANDLASTLKALPGDTLFLNEISASHTKGYAVYLRRVVEVSDKEVATAFGRIPHTAQYARISRLHSPYIYALTQQFANVFSAIGLPDCYEEARESVGARIRSGEF